MKWNIVGAFVRNDPFGTEIAFRKGLERIGETVNVYDPSRPPDLFPLDQDADVTLIFKYLDPGHARDMIKLFRGVKVLYQVDDLRFPHIQQMMNDMRDTCNHALTFDEDGARLARRMGYRAQRLLLTADNQLYKPIPGVVKDIDVSFVGSLSHGANHVSRMRMCQRVQDFADYQNRLHAEAPQWHKPFKFFVANELFDIPKINEIYNRSKIVLNHATDVGQPFGHGYGYQCRHFEAGFAGACVLSNVVVNDNAIQNFYTYDSEETMMSILISLLAHPEDYQRVGDALHAELTANHTPEHRAQELVKFVTTI